MLAINRRNKTFFGDTFYNNLAPQAIDFTDIPGLEIMEELPLKTTFRNLCTQVGQLAGLETEFTRLYNAKKDETADNKRMMVTQLDRIRQLFAAAREEHRGSFRNIMWQSSEFVCTPGVIEKLNEALRRMERRLAGGLPAFFYDAKLSIIDDELQTRLARRAENTHMIADAKHNVLRDVLGLSGTVAPGYFFMCPREVINGVLDTFGRLNTQKLILDNACQRAIEEISHLALPQHNAWEVSNETHQGINNLLAIANIDGTDILDELYNFSGTAEEGITGASKKRNFDAAIRLKVISAAVNSFGFIVAPEMKVLALPSVMNLIKTAEGSYSKHDILEGNQGQKYRAVVIRSNFMNINEIIADLAIGVRSQEHRDEIVAALREVRGDLEGLVEVTPEQQDLLRNTIDNGLAQLNALELQLQEAPIEEPIPVGRDINAITRRLIALSRDNNRAEFIERVQAEFPMGALGEAEAGRKCGGLFDALKSLNATAQEDLEIKAMDYVKAFFRFIAKLILRPVELIIDERIISGPSALAQKEECKNFIGLISQQAAAPVVPAPAL